MEIHEAIIEMKLLERRLTLYEEKYGVLSEDFYTSLMSGELARYDAYLTSTFPHHKDVPPDIKRNLISAPEISFNRPNLPVLIREIEGLSNKNSLA